MSFCWYGIGAREDCKFSPNPQRNYVGFFGRSTTEPVHRRGYNKLSPGRGPLAGFEVTTEGVMPKMQDAISLPTADKRQRGDTARRY
jgi:hypothetical protein